MEESKKIEVEKYVRNTVEQFNSTYPGLIPENALENGVNYYTSDKFKDMTLEEIIEEVNKMISKTIQDALTKMLKELVGDAITDEQLKSKVAEYMKSNNSLDMASFIYIDFTKNFANQEDRLFEQLKKHFTFSNEEIIKNAQKIKDENVKVGQMSIEENHELIKNTLPILSLLVENNVDFYLVGALPAYMITGAEDTRYHDDIDLLLNEEDIPKVKKIVEMYGFTFEDKRFDSPKYFDKEQNRVRGDHELLAQHNTSEFHLGFFCFERGKEGEVIHKDYFKDEEGNTFVYKHNISREESDIAYDDKVHEYEDFRFKMASLESIYRIKKYTQREKDIIDANMIEKSGMLDQSKMAQLDACQKLENTIEPVQQIQNKPIIIEERDINAPSEYIEEQIQTFSNERQEEIRVAEPLDEAMKPIDSSSDLDRMLEPEVKSSEDQAVLAETEKTKVMTYTNNNSGNSNNETGYTTAGLITIILLIIALLAIGTLIYLLV